MKVEIRIRYFVAALVILVSSQLYANGPANLFVVKGLNFIESKSDYKKAIECFDTAISIDEKCVSAFVNRGIAYNLTKSYGKAVVDLNRAILLDSSQDAAIFNRAFAHQMLGNYLFALYDYNNFIGKHPKNALAYFRRSLVHRDMSELSESIEDLTTSIIIDKDNVEYLLERSHLYFKQNNITKSIEDLSKCIELRPKNSSLLIERAQLYTKNKDFKNCSIDLEAALRLDSNNHQAMLALANCRLELSQHWPAIALYTKLIDLNFNKSVVYYNRARAFVRLERYGKAEADLDKCVKNGGKNLGAYLYLRGLARYKLKKYDEACFDWQQADNLGIKKGGDKLNKYCKEKSE